MDRATFSGVPTLVRARARGSLSVLLLLATLGCRSRAAPESKPTERSPALESLALASTPARPASTPAEAPAASGAPVVTSAAPSSPVASGSTVRFIAIGDFGITSEAEKRVADFVLAQKFDFVITLGDNNYPRGSADTIDANIGKYYASLIHPYRGQYGPGGQENRFFPSLGNHDWMTAGARPYLDYFTLPGNERYYELERGPVHLFALDSDRREPDGIGADSVQARWLKERAAASRAKFQVAYMHHPPYSSSVHGNAPELQWPYKQWGIDLVLAGHDHTYERIEHQGLTYVVNGLGGNTAYSFDTVVPGSIVRFNQAHGALLFEVNDRELRGRFVTTAGKTIDEFFVRR